MDCQYLENLYELFVLGSLEVSDAALGREHLNRQCPECLHGLRQAMLTLVALLQMAKPVRSNPKLKSRLMERINE